MAQAPELCPSDGHPLPSLSPGQDYGEWEPLLGRTPGGADRPHDSVPMAKVNPHFPRPAGEQGEEKATGNYCEGEVAAGPARDPSPSPEQHFLTGLITAYSFNKRSPMFASCQALQPTGWWRRWEGAGQEVL